jgi:molybdate transport system regulatory protein
MKLSARNMLAGTVTRVAKGAVNAEVDLTLTGGEKIAAIITNDSAAALGLAEGNKAFAIVKSNWVIVGKDLHKVKMSTRNILCGTVSRVVEGAVNSEVEMKLPGGSILTAVITNESTHALDLTQGEHVCAAFKASSVIIGVE